MAGKRAQMQGGVGSRLQAADEVAQGEADRPRRVGGQRESGGMMARGRWRRQGAGKRGGSGRR